MKGRGVIGVVTPLRKARGIDFTDVIPAKAGIHLEMTQPAAIFEVPQDGSGLRRDDIVDAEEAVY